MAQAKDGDKVKVHFTGKFEDGTVFDSSEGCDPLEFTIGKSEVIPGFEHGVVGMEIKGTKTVNIKCEEAYGPHREEMIMEVSKSDIPKDIKLEEGIQIDLTNPDGLTKRFIILELTDSTVVLDGNHPLAGKDLIFDLTLEAIM